jgi:AcrR family transcriptional regulator
MSKGINTKETILKAALNLTSKFGLESLSIGELAKSVGMSKSGLFGHFKSKERLQIMVMDYAADNFTKKVIIPAIKEERGLPRLEAMMENWKNWSGSHMAGGCPFLSSIVEFDDRPGRVRDHIELLQAKMINTFERTISIAQEVNHIDKNESVEQLAYQMYSNMIGYHIFSRLLKDKNSVRKFDQSNKSIFNR